MCVCNVDKRKLIEKDKQSEQLVSGMTIRKFWAHHDSLCEVQKGVIRLRALLGMQRNFCLFCYILTRYLGI